MFSKQFTAVRRTRIGLVCFVLAGFGWIPFIPTVQAAPQERALDTAGHRAANGAAKLDFKGFAEDYLKVHGLANKDLNFREMMDTKAYGRLLLGSFDIRLPVDALGDKAALERIRDSVHALVNIQRHWYAWSEEVAPGADQDWVVLAKWVASWSPRKLSKLHGGADSMYEQMAAKKKVLEAAEQLNSRALYSGEVAETLVRRNLTVLAPTRKHFHLLSAVAGLVRPDLQPKLWNDNIITQGACWVEFDQIIALENFGYPIQWDKPFLSRDLNESDPNGLKQFVADRASTVLLRKEYYRHGTHFFEESLAINLIIEYLGFNSNGPAEFDFKYSRKGATTQPYSRFVPGGNPAGGTLPKRKARAGPTTFSGSMGGVGDYRKDQGEGFFIKPLKQGQKSGAKLAKRDNERPNRRNKRLHFRLSSLESSAETVVSAPFLGGFAEGKALPANAFLDDYEDFFRAYQSCFFHWLRTQAAGQDSSAKFAQLIDAHAVRELGSTLDSVVQVVYGLPLSGADDSTDSLEFRFLKWLPKAR